MSQTVALSSVGNCMLPANFLVFDFALTTEAHTDANGVVLDGSAVFPAKLGNMPLNWSDVYRAFGFSALGFCVITKHADTGKFVCKVFTSSATGAGTANLTATITVLALLAKA